MAVCVLEGKIKPAHLIEYQMVNNGEKAFKTGRVGSAATPFAHFIHEKGNYGPNQSQC